MDLEVKGAKHATPTNTAKASKRQEMSDRRRRANELFLSGWTQAQVAEFIGVSAATLSTDLKALREEWRKENLATTAQVIDRELTSLAMDERDARDGLAASREQKDKARWHEILLKIRDRRAKLLGLDAPTKVEQTTEISGVRIEYRNNWRPEEDTKTVVLDAIQPEAIPHVNGNGG